MITLRILLLVLVLITPLVPHKNLFAQQRTIYLPTMFTAKADTITGTGTVAAGCSRLRAEEIEMAAEFVSAAAQRRSVMNCNPTLSAVARARAQDMANRHYFGHVNPDGIGPDYLAEQAGYNLPDYYGVTRSSNHVESIAAGGIYPTANDAWTVLLTSESHRVHLLGERDFFREQSEYGVGYAYRKDSRYRHFWVFISANSAE